MDAYVIRDALSQNPQGKPRAEAMQWLADNRFTIAELGADELHWLASAAVRGNYTSSEIALMAGAPRPVWVAYRNSVTRRIAALAHRRARAAYALRRLSVIALRMLGSAILKGL